jgi:hypothetical protein
MQSMVSRMNVLLAFPASSLHMRGFKGFCATIAAILENFFRGGITVNMQTNTRFSLEEEKRRELVLNALQSCGVSQYEEGVVEVLSRWIAQESKAAIQDKRAELISKGLSPEQVSSLILESSGATRNSHS